MTEKNMKPLIVFDLDGTLNRTDLYSVPSHLEAMKHFGAPERVMSREFVMSTFGMRADDYVKLLLPGCDEKSGCEYLRMVADLESKKMKKSGKCFDGVPEMLDKLHQMECQTAVCSNASTRYITEVIAAIGIAEKIDYIQHLVKGMNKNGTLKLLLDRVNPPKAIMVGDRIFDIQAAKANNIPSIGCLYGFNREEALQADYTVEKPIEIADIVEKILKNL